MTSLMLKCGANKNIICQLEDENDKWKMNYNETCRMNEAKVSGH